MSLAANPRLYRISVAVIGRLKYFHIRALITESRIQIIIHYVIVRLKKTDLGENAKWFVER